MTLFAQEKFSHTVWPMLCEAGPDVKGIKCLNENSPPIGREIYLQFVFAVQEM